MENDFTIIILSNNESELNSIGDGIAGILYKKEVTEPYRHIPIKLAEEKLKKFAGDFTGDYFEIKIYTDEGKLNIHEDNFSEVELIPESENKFFYGNGSDRQIEFESDSDGNVNKVWYISGGLRTGLIKKDN